MSNYNKRCDYCGKDYKPQSPYCFANSHFCSHSCRNKYYNLLSNSWKGSNNPNYKNKINRDQTGKNNAMWKGGLTPIFVTIRESTKYKEWRQSIFLRDNFTCQTCKEKGGVLNAHHKKPFSELIDEVREYLPLIPIFEASLIYTPLWDLDNGVTLCKKCHDKTKKGRATR